jgi:SWI/SNF-related matrix-associated actin-dependent regulator of chromatin subfamily A-like protein 1
VRPVPDSPHVTLRDAPGGREVALAFPYDGEIVAAVRTIPGRRFDWDLREWSAPAGDWAGARLAEILERFPELTTDREVDAWLAGIQRGWVGHVRTTRHDGRGWWELETVAGKVPDPLLDGSLERVGSLLVPFGAPAAESLEGLGSARCTAAAVRCIEVASLGEEPPPARLVYVEGVEGPRLVLEVLWDADIGAAFARLEGVTAQGLMLDPWPAEALDAFLAQHGVEVTPLAAEALTALLSERREALRAIRRSQAVAGEPIESVAAVIGGELNPFQWAGVRYVLDARRAFLCDEQGLGKTVQALAALEADDAFPAVVVCPAAMKLSWEREAGHWLPHRTVSVLNGRGVGGPPAEITILNYEIVAAHRGTLARRSPRAIVIDESHLVKNARAKRTQAVKRLADAIPADGLRLALTGTPVLNHADELIAQLRVIDRLEDFGSGARFSREFRGALSEERLHWHLRRRCFVRRLKSEVLPQLPAKRRVVVPAAMTNADEYRLAEDDVIAWLRTQPLDLSTLDAKIAAALRAERLAQLTALQRLAARGKLAAALAWVAEFLHSGEPLVLFARHVEAQEAVLRRFPDALHIVGEDSLRAREQAIASFQRSDGPALIVCATRVAAHGITLTRASNVCFLELEWTPAMHDQAEDRCHRIGQHDAVTAWYLLAADTIDETMARLIQRKREVVAAVTDGIREPADGGLVQAVVRELRDGRPFRHLRAV